VTKIQQKKQNIEKNYRFLFFYDGLYDLSLLDFYIFYLVVFSLVFLVIFGICKRKQSSKRFIEDVSINLRRHPKVEMSSQK